MEEEGGGGGRWERGGGDAGAGAGQFSFAVNRRVGAVASRVRAPGGGGCP